LKFEIYPGLGALDLRFPQAFSVSLTSSMIIGNRKIRERLRKGVEKGRVANAYLFYGPERVGKFAAAREFALELIGRTGFSGGPDKGRDPVDLIVLRPEREEDKGVLKEKDIAVEGVREAMRKLVLFPYVGKRRVLIVDDAHRLTEASQNALLKTLEEPRDHAVLVLVTHEPGRLLPTVLSRCQRAAFRTVPSSETEAWARGLSGGFSQEAAGLLSLGRPGLVAEFLQDPDAFHFQREALEALSRIGRLSMHERLDLAERLSRQPVRSVRILGWWLDLLHGQATECPDGQAALFRKMESVENVLRSLKKSPAAGRLLLENLLVQWDGAP
jgi:hypothetical protein